MRIAHVTATFPPYQGGTGNVCYHNARELVRLGHEVHVFTAVQPQAPVFEVMEGIQVHRLRPLLQIGNAPFLPQLITRLKRFDLIHLHYPFIFGAELVRLAAVLHRTPIVISFHNDLIGDGARARLFALYQRFSSQFSVRPASCLCAVSMDHFESSSLHAQLKESKLLVMKLPNGVDTTLFHPDGSVNMRQQYNIPSDANLVLFVAALDRAHHFKGLDHLLQAMLTLTNSWLLVVGDGDLRAHYEQIAQELGIASRIVFAGPISQRQLPPYYRSADVTVLPSSPPESFGLVLIESMACGTPVIASDIPGVRTVVAKQQDGFLVEPGNSADLATNLINMLALPPDERQTMGAYGRRKVVERYAWSNIGSQLEEMYRNVASPKQQSHITSSEVEAL